MPDRSWRRIRSRCLRTIRKKPLLRGCSNLSIKSIRAHCAPWRRVGPKPDNPRLERDDFSSNRHPALECLFEHDLYRKTGFHFSGSCSKGEGPIGIGGSLTTSPLPHHRTYGSVSGGSAD